MSPAAFGAWIYVAVFGSVAYGSYLWLLKKSTPAKAATYAYVNPVIALILGYFLAGETLTLWSLGCSAVVVAGYYWLCRGSADAEQVEAAERLLEIVAER